MKAVIVAISLGLVAPCVAHAQYFPVKFGEIHDGAVTPTLTLKNCEPSTGYAYGFEIALPPGQSHIVRVGFMAPTIPGEQCTSCRSFTDDFGAHTGRFVKTLDIGSEVGARTLKVFVDDWKLVSQIDYTVVPSKSCP